MDQLGFNIEMASLDEKIALAELEVSKAEERVRELKYRKTQFVLQVLTSSAQQAQK